MSGSPVFFADSGEVFAIHFASNQSTTAFSIPVHQPQLFDWLKLHGRSNWLKCGILLNKDVASGPGIEPVSPP